MKNSNMNQSREERTNLHYRNIVHVIFLMCVAAVITFFALDFVEGIVIEKTGTYFAIPLSWISGLLQVIGCGLIGLFIAKQQREPQVTSSKIIIWLMITIILAYFTFKWFILRENPFSTFALALSGWYMNEFPVFVHFLAAKVANPVIAPAWFCFVLFFGVGTIKKRKEGNV